MCFSGVRVSLKCSDNLTRKETESESESQRGEVI